MGFWWSQSYIFRLSRSLVGFSESFFLPCCHVIVEMDFADATADVVQFCTKLIAKVARFVSSWLPDEVVTIPFPIWKEELHTHTVRLLNYQLSHFRWQLVVIDLVEEALFVGINHQPVYLDQNIAEV